MSLDDVASKDLGQHQVAGGAGGDKCFQFGLRGMLLQRVGAKSYRGMPTSDCLSKRSWYPRSASSTSTNSRIK